MNSSKNLNVLVLSDIHFGELADLEGLGKNRESSLDLDSVVPPIVDLLKEEGLKVDCMVVPGDLTSRGSPVEFKNATRLIDEIAKQLSVDKDHVLVTFGNHDVDWRICGLRHHLETNGDQQSCEVKAKDLGYNDIATAVGGMFTDSYAAHGGPTIGAGVKQINGVEFIILNSGVSCLDSQKLKHGAIQDDQLKWLERHLQDSKKDCPRVLVIHHHLVDMPYPERHWDISKTEESAEILKLLGKYGCNLVIHGHRHHPYLETQLGTGWSKPITFLCAGSFGVGAKERADGHLPNTFHHIQLSYEKGAKFEGLISSFERRISHKWQRLRPSEAHIDQRQYFGPLSDKGNQTSALEKLADDVLGEFANGTIFVPLPSHENLSVDLRVMKVEELDNILSTFFKNKDIELFGAYENKDSKVAAINPESPL